MATLADVSKIWERSFWRLSCWLLVDGTSGAMNMVLMEGQGVGEVLWCLNGNGVGGHVFS